jgi:hypothetical protein
MRRVTIAALMLILLPCSASACFDHEDTWLKEPPARSWFARSEGAEGSPWERMLGVWIVAGSSASLALVGASMRAVSGKGGRVRTGIGTPPA